MTFKAETEILKNTNFEKKTFLSLWVRAGNDHSMSYQPDNVEQTSYIICSMEFAVNLE